MSANAAMPTWWGDYARDTGHLNNAGHGAYLMLIKHYWCTGQPLPDDDATLWRVACCDSIVAWRKLRPVIAPFFQVGGGLWRHKRIDAELARAAERSRRRSEAGQKGNDTRWSVHRNATPQPSQSHRNATPMDIAMRSHPYPYPYPPSEDDGGGVDAGAQARVREAAESVVEAARADPSKQAGWMTAEATVAKWLSGGCDLDLDVLPTVRAITLTRGGQGPPNGPGYFTRAILEAKERRLAPLPTVTVKPPDAVVIDDRSPRHRRHDDRRAEQADAFAAALGDRVGHQPGPAGDDRG
ncbi:MAG: YdaU family protein [Alphaproteobacteria bacterium]